MYVSFVYKYTCYSAPNRYDRNNNGFYSISDLSFSHVENINALSIHSHKMSQRMKALLPEMTFIQAETRSSSSSQTATGVRQPQDYKYNCCKEVLTFYLAFIVGAFIF